MYQSQYFIPPPWFFQPQPAQYQPVRPTISDNDVTINTGGTGPQGPQAHKAHKVFKDHQD